jgi:PAS domain S-box-containing protein
MAKPNRGGIFTHGEQLILSQSFFARVSRVASKPLVAGALAAGVLLVSTGIISYWVYTVRLHDELQETSNVAIDARDRLRIALIHGLSATQTIALCVEQGILPREFDTVAPRIARAYSSIDAVELTIGGVVGYVYPYEENKKAIGFNILTDSLQKDEALLAIRNRNLIFAGPLNLVQGGLAVVGRGPVFLKKNGKDVFWGFTIVIIRMKTLIAQAHLDEFAGKGFACRVSKRDLKTGNEVPFFSNSDRFEDPVAVDVAVPNGEWLLEMAPINGWKARQETVPTVFLSLVLSCIGGAFVWYMARQPRLLKILVEKRAAELLASERRFTTLIESAPVAISIMRAGKILYANPALHRMLLASVDERVDDHDVTEFLTPESAEGVKDRISRRTNGVSVSPETELTFIRSDGAHILVHVTVATMSLNDGEAQVAFLSDITLRRQAEQRLSDSLKEKELLLKEIHHRVKNNLQVISSLLALQSQRVTDGEAREGYADSIRRVRSMALVHERLYRTNDLSQIDFREYLHSVTNELGRSLQREGVTLEVAAETIMLGIDVAVPCGLIANELVSNALKHAFGHQVRGTVVLSFKRLNQTTLELEVKDDGVGFPRGADYRTMSSMGMAIVRTLTDQISGTLRMDGTSGTRFTIVFPG